MAHRELLSPEGLRQDGRRAKEIRAIHVELGTLARVDGSAMYAQGFTKVLASVHGPHEATFRGKALHDKAFLTCEFNVASFAAGERRRAARNDRQGQELALAVKETFEAVVMTELFPRSEINIFIEVLQADGDTLCAAINATTLALVNAGIPLRAFVTACTAGAAGDAALLDVNFVEKSAGGAVLSAAVQPHDGGVCMLRCEARLPVEEVEPLLALATDGCAQIHKTLMAAVKASSLQQLEARGIMNS
jgi:exosome complex component RRP41